MKPALDEWPWPARAPRIELEQVRQVSGDGPGFLRVVRRELVAVYEDGSRSNPFVYDEVDRAALDAVVICAHFLVGSERWVYLRSALRPPLRFRTNLGEEDLHDATSGSLWELPAGLIEVDEIGEQRVEQSAVRELEEELGFQMSIEDFKPLGPATFPCPGVIGERQFFVEVRVDPILRNAPSLDGSPLEHGGRVATVRLTQALKSCAEGEITDAKTELGLRRLTERYGC